METKKMDTFGAVVIAAMGGAMIFQNEHTIMGFAIVGFSYLWGRGYFFPEDEERGEEQHGEDNRGQVRRLPVARRNSR